MSQLILHDCLFGRLTLPIYFYCFFNWGRAAEIFRHHIKFMESLTLSLINMNIHVCLQSKHVHNEMKYNKTERIMVSILV